MALPVVLGSQKLLIRIGDGGTPELFTAPCALNAKRFTRSADAPVSTPSALYGRRDTPLWTGRLKGPMTSELSGSGVLARDSLDLYEVMLEEQIPRRLRIELGYPDWPRIYEGPYILLSLSLTGQNREYVQVELEFVSSGVIRQIGREQR